MTEFIMELAGQTVRVSALFESTKEYCREFLLPEPAEGACGGASEAAGPAEEDRIVSVRSSEAAIDAERARLEAFPVQQYSDPYLETLAIYRQIAEAMPEKDVLLMHGSAVSVDGKGYLFTARSGVGKSTHVRLWREVLPSLGHEVRMINDDKPLLRFKEDGIFVCGTPWMGKHRLGGKRQAPLAGICYLERGTENRTEPMKAGEIWKVLLTLAYRPQEPAAMEKTMKLLDRLVHEVPFCHLYCNMERQAAETSWRGLQEAGLPED